MQTLCMPLPFVPPADEEDFMELVSAATIATPNAPYLQTTVGEVLDMPIGLLMYLMENLLAVRTKMK